VSESRLHAVRAGSGPPVVLLHGFTGAAESWSSVVAALDGHTTIAVDLPGHGRSDAPADPARYGLRAFADDLALLLDAEGIDRAAVLGYSLGGRAALRFALAHPARTAALLLESASPGIADAAERAARVESDSLLADTIEREGVPAFVDRWERLPLWESQFSLSPTVRERLRAQRLRNGAAGLANSLRGAGAGLDEPLLDRLPAQRAPALILAGALDVKYAAHAKAIAAAMPAARLEIVADAGHAIHLERPAELAALVNDFLRGVPATGSNWSERAGPPVTTGSRL
jgi:2-succinyl-6-hydroxy-2,4-cyclohexadiene-1-carboxylate synthase